MVGINGGSFSGLPSLDVNTIVAPTSDSTKNECQCVCMECVNKTNQNDDDDDDDGSDDGRDDLPGEIKLESPREFLWTLAAAMFEMASVPAKATIDKNRYFAETIHSMIRQNIY